MERGEEGEADREGENIMGEQEKGRKIMKQEGKIHRGKES